MLNLNEARNESALLQQGKLVGRESHLQDVRAAINKDGSHVFFFTGEGGIGKTRLLNEIGRYVAELQGNGQRVLWSGVIDLYHSDMHSNSRIEESLIKALDEKDDYFREYEKRRQEFEQQRQAGLMGAALEPQRRALTEAFAKGFELLTQAYRVVLTFDTLELVQYESSSVRQLCEIEDEGASSVKNWLLGQVAQFDNTVTIFAGRPHKDVQTDFERYFSAQNCHYEEKVLERFTLSEARDYLYELAKRHDELGHALNTETVEQIYQGADQGRPIYINLLVDLLSFGEDIADIFPLKVREIDSAYLIGMKQRIANRLVNLPEDLQSYIVRYLALARQGVDPDLLSFLLKGAYGRSEIEAAIEAMKAYAFIKTHPLRPDQIFLHDEVYDILEEYYLDKRTEDIEPMYRSIRDYYEDKRSQIVKKRQLLNVMTGPQDIHQHEKLIRDLADLSATTLHYELHVDPLPAFYRKYVRWAEEAIKAQQVGFDMRLRDIVLTFYNNMERLQTSRRQRLSERLPQPERDRMNAILWLRRYLSRGDFQKCYRVARKMANSTEPAFAWPNVEDDYYKAALLTIMGEAMLYLKEHGKDETLKVLSLAISLLAETQQDEPDEARDETWRWARIQGRAYNNKAFVYRQYHQYSTAVKPYQHAIAIYRNVDIRDEMADSINNLAFVYANLGALDEAEALADDGRSLRESLWQRYVLGYSYNTLGEVHVAARHPHQGRGFSQQALSLFSPTDNPLDDSVGFERGQALARFTLGKVYRTLGGFVDSHVYTAEEAIAHFKQGRNYLRNAIKFFDQEGGDYEISAKSELGRLFRDWMRLDLKNGDDEGAYDRKDLALQYLEEAYTISETQRRLDDMANILEDIARVHWAWKDREKAEAYLSRAEQVIPEEYKPRPGKGFTQVIEPVNPLWVALGKVYLLKADILFNPDEYIGPLSENQIEALLSSMEYRLLAVGCFEVYSPYSGSSRRMEETRKAMYDSLKRYGIPRLERLRHKMEEVGKKYDLNLQSVFDYIDRTMGFYFIVPD